MEESIGSLLRLTLQILRYLVVELVCELLFYWTGRLSLYVLTLGRYPSKIQQREHEGRIMLVGFIVISFLFLPFLLLLVE